MTILHIAGPQFEHIPIWAMFVDRLLRALGWIWFACSIRQRAIGWPIWKISVLAGALGMALSETLRLVAVDLALTQGLQHGTWPYTVLVAAANATASFVFAAVSTAMVLLSNARRWRLLLGIGVAVAALYMFAVRPLTDSVVLALSEKLVIPPAPETVPEPYPVIVRVLAYGLNIEPTLATLVIIAFIWPVIGRSDSSRLLKSILIVTLMTGRPTMLTLFSLWEQAPIATSLLRSGQFFLSNVTMVVLAALTWLATTSPDRKSRRAG